MLRRAALAAGLLLLAGPAFSQGAPGTRIVVSSCGTPPITYNPNQPAPTTMDTTGQDCVNSGGATPPIAVVVATDRGGTITVGGTAQTAAALNTARKGFVIQNPCTATGQGIATAEDLYVSVTGSATVAGAGNYADLPPCGSATVQVSTNTVLTAAVSVNATTTGHRWSATETQ